MGTEKGELQQPAAAARTDIDCSTRRVVEAHGSGNKRYYQISTTDRTHARTGPDTQRYPLKSQPRTGHTREPDPTHNELKHTTTRKTATHERTPDKRTNLTFTRTHIQTLAGARQGVTRYRELPPERHGG